jgi:hypothetical protein
MPGVLFTEFQQIASILLSCRKTKPFH